MTRPFPNQLRENYLGTCPGKSFYSFRGATGVTLVSECATCANDASLHEDENASMKRRLQGG